MAIYVCIILQKSTPLEVRDTEANSLEEAVATALSWCREHPTSTAYEVWQHGKKLRTGVPRHAVQ